MAEFIYYEVDQDAVTPALRKRLFTIAGLRMRPAADGARWLVRSPSEVPRFKAGRIVKEELWAASLKPQSRDSRPRDPEKSTSRNLIALAWRIAPGTRLARISRRSLTPKRSSLLLVLGEGTGDAVAIEVDTPLPTGVTGLRLELRTARAVALTVEPKLHLPRGRALASFEVRSVSAAGSSTIDWALPELPAVDRSRIGKLSFTFSTEADRGSVFIDSIAFAV